MDGMDLMAGAMRAARTRLDVAANNLANVSTDGFHKARAEAALTAHGIILRIRTADGQGALRHTGAPFDLAIVGPGAFDVGGHKTRLGSFSADRDGFLADAQGRRVRGERGPISVGTGTRIEPDGSVRGDRGETNRIPLPHGSSIRTGFLEGPNADAIGEMIEVLNAQRAFETAQKTLLAIDDVRERAISDVERLK
jgi:flagellar basal body rod protein FlgG